MAALRANPRVALTIDDASSWPYRVLLLRGEARIETVAGVAPEYAAAAERYFGPTAAKPGSRMSGNSKTAWCASPCARIGSALLDFESRFPQAIANKMAQV